MTLVQEAAPNLKCQRVQQTQWRNWSALQRGAECYFRIIYQVAPVIPAILFIDSVPFESAD